MPLQVKGLPHGNITDLQLGGYASMCAVINASSVWCWGYNGHGDLGDGTTTNRYTPVMVKGLANNITDLALGYLTGCAIEGTAADGSTGAVKCWGNNVYGQLGDGTTTHRYTPVDTGLRNAVLVKMAQYHTKVLTSDGTLYAFGYNGYCQLGDGTYTTRSSPVDVSLTPPYRVASISLGVASSHILTGNLLGCA